MPSIARRLGNISLLVSLMGVVIGLEGLAGWLLGNEVMFTILPDRPPVMPNTALGLVLGGAATALLVREPVTRARRILASAFALVVLALGILTTLEYLLGVDLGMGQLIVMTDIQGPAHSGHPSPPTAVAFVLLGVALLAFDVVAARAAVREWFALGVLSIALVCLVGHAYGAGRLYQMTRSPIIGVSLHAATGFLLIGAGALLARPNVGLIGIARSSTAGALLFRRLAVPAIVAPALVGLVIRAALVAVGLKDLPLTLALLTTAMIAIVLVLIVLAARPLDRINAALEASRARFQALLADAPDGVFIADLEGRYTEINRAACRMLGYAREELIGKMITDLLPPEDLPRFEQHAQAVMRGDAEVSEWRLRRRDGAYLPVEVSAKVLESGDWQAFVRDITARKRADRERAQWEERLNGIIAIAADAIISVDDSFRVVIYNSGAEKIFGWTADEMLGQPLDVLLPTRVREAHRAHLRAFAAEHVTARAISDRARPILGRRKNGEEFPAEAAISHLKTDTGHFFTVLLRDISDRVAFERELLETKNLLQNVLDSATESGITALDLERRVVLWNEGARRLFGHTAEEVVGKVADRLYSDSEESLASFAGLLEHALAEGQATGIFRCSPKDRAMFFAHVVITRRDDASGKPTGFLLITNDITRERRLAEQNTLMADVSEALVATTDIRDLVKRVAESVVPGFADACGLFVLQDRETHAELIHHDPSRADLAEAWKRLSPLSGSWLRSRAFETREASLIPATAPGSASGSADGRERDDEREELFQQLRVRSMIDVPLLARDRCYGAMVFLRTEPDRLRYDREDFCVAQEIARRATVAVENALLYEDSRLQGTIAGHLPEGVVLTTVMGGIIVYTNPRFDQMFGYEIGELVGRHISIVNAPGDLSAEERAAEIIGHLNQVGAWSGEIQNVRKDGSTFWCYARSSGFEHPRFGPVWASVHSDISDRKRLEAQNERALRDKEMLLKEVHHRVKNNLQIIASLFYLQGQTVRESRTKQILDESRDRIQSIALVHELLYRSSDFAAIVFDEYLQTLLAGLASTHGALSRKIEVELHAENVILSIEHAIPCGLLVNEILTNAFKHAFPGERGGKIWVFASHHGGEVVIEVGDDGIGIPEGIDCRRGTSMGMQLIQALGRQLHGTIELDRSKGTHFVIRFPCTLLELEEIRGWARQVSPPPAAALSGA